MKQFFAVVVAVLLAACSGAVQEPPVADAGVDADRSLCDWSLLDCSDQDLPACVEALSEVACDAPVPDACKPCIRAL